MKNSRLTLRSQSILALCERVVRMLVGFFISILVARYLEPEQFGQLNFVLAWIGIFGSIAWLGVGDAVVRDLATAPSDCAKLIGTVSIIRLAGGLLAGLLCYVLFLLIHHHESITLHWMVVLASVSLCLNIGGVPALWLQAESRSAQLSAVNFIQMFLSNLYRVVLLLCSASLIWFSLLPVIESVILGVLLWFFFFKFNDKHQRLSYCNHTAWKHIREGVPILIASSMSYLAMRIDQLMLAQLTSFKEVGIYAAALRFSEVWWIIPTTLLQVLVPKMLFTVPNDTQRKTNLIKLYSLFFYSALVLALVVQCFSPLLVQILGKNYIQATAVLVIHVWTALFIFIDAPTYHELLRQRAQKILLIKSTVSLILNIGLNYLWIPEFGAAGAAYATLLSAGLTLLIFGCSHSITRQLLILQWQAICYPIKLIK